MNTCAFIDRAREESVNTILGTGAAEGARALPASLIVTGCLTQRYGREILRELPEVDGMLGTSELSAHRRPRAPGRGPSRLGDRGAARLPLRRDDAAAGDGARARTRTSRSPKAATWGARSARSLSSAGEHRSRPLADIVSGGGGPGPPRGMQEADARLRRTRWRTGAICPGNGDVGDLLLGPRRTRACRGSGRCTCTRPTSTTG